ncbi:MbcA/ParS/Xre antitoxin family protein [Variovorax sp. J31P216]|nr:MbcA/ParS/Xre antitoxin family protein [Variovorax sp. J31P216]MDM0028015.1 MbcA/ParS/Xre antitoxin family protein [Variovorax sp. J31P216]
MVQIGTSAPEIDLDKLEQDLPTLAAQVFGAHAQMWLSKPHELLQGQSPAEFAARGGLEKVRSILNMIRHGGVA